MKQFFKIFSIIMSGVCFIFAIVSFVYMFLLLDLTFLGYFIGLILAGCYSIALLLYLKDLDARDLALLARLQETEKRISSVDRQADRLETKIINVDKLLYEMENNQEYQAVLKKQKIADLEKQLQELKKDDQ